jgi:peptide/nickel transport system substrate-binding protein
MDGSPAYSRREFLLNASKGTVLLGSAALLGACGSSATSPAPSGAKRGGTLLAGISAGSSSDTLEGSNPINFCDWARAFNLYNGLIYKDASGAEQLQLADEITSNATATRWVIRLKKGVTFHNGKTVTADDVIFTFRRIVKNSFEGASGLALVEMSSLRALDNYTVELTTTAPYSTFIDTLGDWYYFILPVGYDPAHPVGTGPFKYKSFTPGTESVFVRNGDYFVAGLPYLDELIISDYPDDTARLDALESGAVDCIDQIPPAAVATVKSTPGSKILMGGYLWNPITMRVDVAPFDDVRVRQAMRLIANRPDLIKSSLDGYGVIGNDLFGRFDPDYDTSLPQRHQDLDQARSLLRAAGQSDLHVPLYTGDVANGIVEGATVFAQQARSAGVTVDIVNMTPGDFFGPTYLQRAFSQDTWSSGTPYFTQVSLSMLPNSPFNETHWNDSQYTALYHEAEAELDSAKRRELAWEMQKIEWNNGGYLIYSYFDIVDGYRDNVHGLVPSEVGWSLGNYGFDRVWLS